MAQQIDSTKQWATRVNAEYKISDKISELNERFQVSASVGSAVNKATEISQVRRG